jgi:tRNA threonylcarbamoyladenosine biosynthesis protein TsaE
MNEVIETEQIQYSNLSELKEVADKIIGFSDNIKVWAFEGEMGAGKTTLIKEICRSLEVEDNVTSPTFSLVNEYYSLKGNTIYHFDFYRLKEESEALDFGVEEYLYSGNYCFLEWPSKIPMLLPLEIINIDITVNENIRTINLSKKKRSIN